MNDGGLASPGARTMPSGWKSSITTEKMKKKNERLDPVHPGDVLREDFMKPLGLSAYAVAKAIGATSITISLIIRRKRAVSAEMALKLGRLFNVSAELWMGIQADYDLEVARLKSAQRIERSVQPWPGLDPVTI
jgi:antitoxin HigA-1